MRYVGASTVDPLDLIRRGDLTLLDRQIDSRNGGLVTNGTGALADNTGFTEFSGFDPTVVPDGMAGSFKAEGKYLTRGDQVLPVDPGQVYRLRCLVKGNAQAVTDAKKFYFGLIPFDALGNGVEARTVYRIGLKVALTRPWTPNVDTSVFVDADPGWDLATTLAYRQGVLVYGYVDTNGTPHVDYTRNRIEQLWTTGAAPTITDIGGGEWEIAGLNPATAVGLYAQANYNEASTIPAGIQIAQMNSGGNYLYTAASGALLTEDWVEYVGYITGVDATGKPRSYNFWPGTASVKLLFLNNAFSPTSAHTTWVAGLDFRPVRGFTRTQIAGPTDQGGTYFQVPTDRLDQLDNALAFQ